MLEHLVSFIIYYIIYIASCLLRIAYCLLPIAYSRKDEHGCWDRDPRAKTDVYMHVVNDAGRMCMCMPTTGKPPPGSSAIPGFLAYPVEGCLVPGYFIHVATC